MNLKQRNEDSTFLLFSLFCTFLFLLNRKILLVCLYVCYFGRENILLVVLLNVCSVSVVYRLYFFLFSLCVSTTPDLEALCLQVPPSRHLKVPGSEVPQILTLGRRAEVPPPPARDFKGSCSEVHPTSLTSRKLCPEVHPTLNLEALYLYVSVDNHTPHGQYAC